MSAGHNLKHILEHIADKNFVVLSNISIVVKQSVCSHIILHTILLSPI